MGLTYDCFPAAIPATQLCHAPFSEEKLTIEQHWLDHWLSGSGPFGSEAARNR